MDHGSPDLQRALLAEHHGPGRTSGWPSRTINLFHPPPRPVGRRRSRTASPRLSKAPVGEMQPLAGQTRPAHRFLFSRQARRRHSPLCNSTSLPRRRLFARAHVLAVPFSRIGERGASTPFFFSANGVLDPPLGGLFSNPSSPCRSHQASEVIMLLTQPVSASLVTLFGRATKPKSRWRQILSLPLIFCGGRISVPVSFF